MKLFDSQVRRYSKMHGPNPASEQLVTLLDETLSTIGRRDLTIVSDFRAFYEAVVGEPMPTWQHALLPILTPMDTHKLTVDEMQQTVDLILAPPGHGKTTLLSAYAAWLIGRNPNIRILVVSYAEDNAVSLLNFIEGFLRTDAFISAFGNLIPRERSNWGSTRRTVLRSTNLKDATLTAVGILGGNVGHRIDFILGDDIVTFENSRTPAMRNTMWRRFTSTIMGRLEPYGRIVIIGHQFHADDLYGRIKRMPDTRVHEFPASPEKPLWPERWPSHILAKIAERDPIMFRSQYLHQPPSDSGNSSLRKSWLHFYVDEPPLEKRDYVLGVDLSATEHGDLFSVAAVYTLPGLKQMRVKFVDRVWALHLPPERQLDFVRARFAELSERSTVSAVVVEANAFQKSAADKLSSLGLPVVPVQTNTPKDIRIRAMVEQFKIQNVLLRGHLENGSVIPHPSVTSFVKAWEEYPGGHDDPLDAVWYALFGKGEFDRPTPATVIINKDGTTRHKRRRRVEYARLW